MNTTIVLILIILSPLIILLGITLWWFYVFLKFKKALKIYPSIAEIPFYGLTYKFKTTEDFYNTWLSYHKMVGKNAFTMMGFYPTLSTCDPNLFAKILGSPKHINKTNFYSLFSNLVERSLLIVNGDEWRQQRKLLNTVYQNSTIMKHLDLLNKHSDNLIKYLKKVPNNLPVDITVPVMGWFLEQTFERIIGRHEDPEFLRQFHKIIRALTKIIAERILRVNEYFDFTYFFSRNYWLEKKMMQFILPHVEKIISIAKQEIERNPKQREKLELIDALLKLKENNETITHTVLAKQFLLMFVAEFETTSMTICFAIYHLSQHPEIQQQAFEEISSIVENNKTPITRQQINNLTYLELFLKESMRLTPAIPLIARKLDEDVEFEGSILPKGLTIIFLIHAMHLHPEIYPEPESFIPERFLQHNMNPNRYSYMPFSGGIRNCIGQKVAMVLLKIVLTKLILNYKFTDAKHKPVLVNNIVLNSRNGVKVIIEKRS